MIELNAGVSRRRCIFRQAVDQLRRTVFPALILCTAVLTGCSSITNKAERIDIRQAYLMPKPEAISVFEKHGFGEWVKSPYLIKPWACGGQKIQVHFGEIDIAVYGKLRKQLVFARSIKERGGLCSQEVVFKDIKPEVAKELMLAARTLGARITEFSGIPPRQD